MEISSVASQAMSLKEHMSAEQLGVAALKQAHEVDQKVVDLLANKAPAVQAPKDSQSSGFSTYA